MSSKCLHSKIPSPESCYGEETGSGEARTHGNAKEHKQCDNSKAKAWVTV